ncbi:hypothetical protein U1Q18_028938 [Sarracenia purpurea var. burkii]
MKDLSFFLLKNSLGAKMRKGYGSFCIGDNSTSILNQQESAAGTGGSCSIAGKSLGGSGSSYLGNRASGEKTPPTLEEMILQLEFEEKMARNAKLDEYGEIRGRMSCVNNSDILRSARNALNQYPRFSLDGKDAMYRSSFRNLPPISTGGRKSICSDHGLRKGLKNMGGFNPVSDKTPVLPPVLAGERVVWCKPGVVAKLMGLEAMPIPVNSNSRKEKLMISRFRKQNIRKRADKHEMERRKIVMDVNINRGEIKRSGMMMGSCSSNGHCVMRPIKVEPAKDEAGWPIQRFA